MMPLQCNCKFIDFMINVSLKCNLIEEIIHDTGFPNYDNMQHNKKHSS